LAVCVGPTEIGAQKKKVREKLGRAKSKKSKTNPCPTPVSQTDFFVGDARSRVPVWVFHARTETINHFVKKTSVGGHLKRPWRGFISQVVSKSGSRPEGGEKVAPGGGYRLMGGFSNPGGNQKKKIPTQTDQKPWEKTKQQIGKKRPNPTKPMINKTTCHEKTRGTFIKAR